MRQLFQLSFLTYRLEKGTGVPGKGVVYQVGQKSQLD